MVMIKLKALLSEDIKRTAKILSNEKFMSWFGHSQVVDNHGNPLVVFHGTKRPIEKFSNKRIGAGSTVLGNYEVERYGIFAAEDPELAREFMNQGEDRPLKNGHIIPLYMKIEAPLDTIKRSYSDGMFNSVEAIAIDLGGDGYRTARILGEKWQSGKMWELFDKDGGNDPEYWIQLFKKMDYDGLKIYEASEKNRNDTWVAFDADQVKFVRNLN